MHLSPPRSCRRFHPAGRRSKHKARNARCQESSVAFMCSHRTNFPRKRLFRKSFPAAQGVEETLASTGCQYKVLCNLPYSPTKEYVPPKLQFQSPHYVYAFKGILQTRATIYNRGKKQNVINVPKMQHIVFSLCPSTADAAILITVKATDR